MLAVIATACYGGDNPNLTSTGMGKPQLSLDFPKQLQPGDEAKLVLSVSNPGPGDIAHLFVSFSLLGAPTAPNGQLLALIPIGARHQNPAVASIDPKPEGVSSDGDIYRFGPLREGRSTTITFTLRAPESVGEAQNSVQVYDGSEPDRSVGLPLRVTVGG